MTEPMLNSESVNESGAELERRADETLIELWGRVLFDQPEQIGPTQKDTIYELAKDKFKEYYEQKNPWELERAIRQDIIDNGGEKELQQYDEGRVQTMIDLWGKYNQQKRESAADIDEPSGTTVTPPSAA